PQPRNSDRSSPDQKPSFNSSTHDRDRVVCSSSVEREGIFRFAPSFPAREGAVEVLREKASDMGLDECEVFSDLGFSNLV
ncbi:hypothetical protein G4B88_019115, partial [Cannabis sativa]